MSNTKEQVWYSGDWKTSGSNLYPPYNGLKILAVSTYETTENPLIKGKLMSIDLTITDFTYDVNGISSTFTVSKTGMWYEIPFPMNDNKKFTVSSVNGGGPGVVRIVEEPSGIFLFIQFRYGLESMKREEIGYIMRFTHE